MLIGFHFRPDGEWYGVTVRREKGDKPFRSESAFWYALKKRIISATGKDVVKRITTKDGHMFGCDQTYYLRERGWGWAIIDQDWALWLLHETYNKREGEGVFLQVTVWDKRRSITREGVRDEKAGN